MQRTTVARSELTDLLSGDAASLLDTLLANLPIGLTIAEPPDVRIVRVSDAGAALIGRPKDRLEGITVEQHSEAYQVYDPRSGALAASEELPLTRATKGESVKNEEWLLRTGNASELTILCNAGPIHNAVGEVIGGLLAWADISEKKDLEKKLTDSVVARDRLLSELYHRISNHLQLVGAIVRAEARKCDDVTLFVEKIEQRLLALGSAYSALRGAHEEVSAATFLSQVCEPLQSDLVKIDMSADLGLRLSAQHAPTVGIVVNEAICNAIKHAFLEGSRGEVSVSAVEEGEHFVIRIADNGVGMKHALASTGQGQELMLNLMRGIGGKLEVSSTPERGTTITAYWSARSGSSNSAGN